MLFNSYEFLFAFLPVTWLGHEILRRYGQRQGAMVWLVAASAVFYASWNANILLVLAGSIVINYLIACRLSRIAAARGRGRKDLLILGLVFNLGLLGYFKYTNFLVDNLDALAGLDFVIDRIVLPIGISFFTFQKIAFLIDSYRGEARQRGFLEFCLFVMFFPQLIAGPIVHYSEVMPQFAKTRLEPAFERLAVGLTILVIGLIKKVGIADMMAVPASTLFDGVVQGHQPALVESWIGTLSYAFQIYFDFSGYSDMAVGLGWMFGIRLPINFASPYKAASIAEFWQRWHITLSRFLKAYLYIPLGGNSRGSLRTYINLFLTMLLGGIWHGAAWTFALWGAVHGVMLMLHRLWRGSKAAPARRLSPWAARALTFLCVILAWVPFRAPDIATAVAVYKGLAGLNGLVLPTAAAQWTAAIPGLDGFVSAGPLGVDKPLNTALWLAGLLALAWFAPNTYEWMGRASPGLPTAGYPATAISDAPRLLAWRPTVVHGVALAAALVFCVIKLNDISPFIYFQF